MFKRILKSLVARLIKPRRPPGAPIATDATAGIDESVRYVMLRDGKPVAYFYQEVRGLDKLVNLLNLADLLLKSRVGARRLLETADFRALDHQGRIPLGDRGTSEADVDKAEGMAAH